MKTNKTISDKVLAANRANALKSTGPRDCGNSKMNALKHGLLAKRLRLKEDQQAEFDEILAELEAEFTPETATQRMMLEELATDWWKLQETHSWEMQHCQNRSRSADVIFQIVDSESAHDELSSLGRGEELSKGAHLGWECEQLLVRSGNQTQEEEMKGIGCSSSDKQTRGHMVVEARVSTGMEPLLRYQRSLKKDFFRAMDVLRRLKGLKGVSGPTSG